MPMFQIYFEAELDFSCFLKSRQLRKVNSSTHTHTHTQSSRERKIKEKTEVKYDRAPPPSYLWDVFAEPFVICNLHDAWN